MAYRDLRYAFACIERYEGAGPDNWMDKVTFTTEDENIFDDVCSNAPDDTSWEEDGDWMQLVGKASLRSKNIREAIMLLQQNPYALCGKKKRKKKKKKKKEPAAEEEEEEWLPALPVQFKKYQDIDESYFNCN